MSTPSLCSRGPVPRLGSPPPLNQGWHRLRVKGHTEGLNLGNDPICVFRVGFCRPQGAMVKMLCFWRLRRPPPRSEE